MRDANDAEVRIGDPVAIAGEKFWSYVGHVRALDRRENMVTVDVVKSLSPNGTQTATRFSTTRPAIQVLVLR